MPLTVLMADDSIPLHALVRSQLERDELNLESAYDGETALSMATTVQPNLILLDLDLPQRDGFSVCRALKANPATASVPLLFLTADSVVENKVKGLDMGAVDYITKPFKGDELRARVRCALRVKHTVGGASMFDPQTGLRTRAYLYTHLPAKLSMARQTGKPLGCIVVTINDFRSIGKNHGAAIAGEAQRGVGHVLQGHCRADDTIARVDSGKFAILLNGTGSEAAAKIADRLAADIARRLQYCEGIELNVQCNFGVADTLGAADEDDLIERASNAVRPRRSLS